MTFRRLWASLAVLLPVLGAMLAGLSTTDLTYHLRAGSEMLAGGGIPRVDTWTYTVAGQPWHDQQWAAQVLFALVERIGGWTGLAVTRAALVGATFGLVALTAYRRGVGVRTAAGLALARVRGLGGRARASAAAGGHGAVRADAVPGRRTASTSPPPVADPSHHPHLGEHPRLVLPGPRAPGAGLDRGSRGPVGGTGAPARATPRRRRVGGGGTRQSVGHRGLGVRDRPDDAPATSRPG